MDLSLFLNNEEEEDDMTFYERLIHRSLRKRCTALETSGEDPDLCAKLKVVLGDEIKFTVMVDQLLQGVGVREVDVVFFDVGPSKAGGGFGVFPEGIIALLTFLFAPGSIEAIKQIIELIMNLFAKVETHEK